MRNFLVECDSGNGEKIVSSSGAGKTGQPHEKQYNYYYGQVATYNEITESTE